MQTAVSIWWVVKLKLASITYPLRNMIHSRTLRTDKGIPLIGVANIGVAAVGNYIYMPGGTTNGGVTIAELQRYDIQSNTVVTMTSMPALECGACRGFV
ncbi:MAG: kelch repeat-containing protein [Chloroflexota bacterium]